MKRWNQWTRKHEGWVERRRRFQKVSGQRIPEAAGQKVPAVAGVTVPETRVTVSNRGEKVNIRPLKDHIVALRIEEKEKKVGGLVIPDTAKEKPMTAKVVAVGTGRVLDNGKRVPLEVKKGAKVLIGKYAGSEVKLDGVDYLILREDDVLGIVG